MTGRPARREALHGASSPAGTVPAGARREALHARGLEPAQELAQDGPARSEPLHVDEAGTRPQDGPPAHREALYRAELERMAAQRDQLAGDVAAGRPVDVAGTIRAQLAEAYRAAAGLEAAQHLEGAGTGRPRGLAGLQRAELAGLDVDGPAAADTGPRGLFQACPDTVRPYTRPAGLPPAAAQLLERITRGPAAQELAELTQAGPLDPRRAPWHGIGSRPAHERPAAGLPPAMRDPAADARAALAQHRPQLAQDGPELERRPPFTVSPALAGLIGEDRPRVIADAVRRHALAEAGRLVDELEARPTAGRPGLEPLELAEDGPGLAEWQCPACGATTRARMADHGPSSPRLTCTDAANPQVSTPRSSPTNRKHDPAPTTTNRRPSIPDTHESSAGRPDCTRGAPCPFPVPCAGPCHLSTLARPARSGLAPLGVPALAALIDAAHESEQVTARALATLAGTPHPFPVPEPCPRHGYPHALPCPDDTPQERPQELEHRPAGTSRPAGTPQAGTRAQERAQDVAQELEACPVRPWAQCVPGELEPAACRAQCARLADVLAARARELAQDRPQPEPPRREPLHVAQDGPDVDAHACGMAGGAPCPRGHACHADPCQDRPACETVAAYRPQDRPQHAPSPFPPDASELHPAGTPQDTPQTAPSLPGTALPAPVGHTLAGPRPHACGRPQNCQHAPQDGPQELAGLPVVEDERVPPGVVRLSSFVELAGPQDVDERDPIERLADDVREAGTWTRHTYAVPMSRAQLVDLGLVEPTEAERAELEASHAAWQAAQELQAAPVRTWQAIRATQRARSRPQTTQHDRPEA